MTEGRSGILVVDKAAGVTSFDVVAAVRRALRLRRVGHAGTLDPAATGVLPILLGEATKLMPYLVDQDKEYLATIRLGITTDTGDLTGRVTSTAAAPPLEWRQVERVLAGFIGRVRQTPPMYSAVHHEGRRLYELAREGVEVERASREVVVHAITLEALDPGSMTLRIICGKGTYVRSFVGDLGVALGCGATVARLVRTRVGPFLLAEAVASPEIGTLDREGLGRQVRPPEAALATWPGVTLDDAGADAFLHGQVAGAPGPLGAGTLVRVHDGGGRMIGVGQIAPSRAVQPVRILHADRPGSRRLPA
ncbi:MAG: tRNA pseudouridine(55) synthase TruB [Candidatus Rokubacteria bacterium]|nr:tRNA pseudouridine(55) synthase TruB [Candidatus Rokubacteria bacterium]MBI3827215.1 tRNA pseudouridine(55) synthase TruB [Candidatus Rokubacteria bacterium]